jgi:hypothetical protein
MGHLKPTFPDSATYYSLGLQQGIFVIGKATPTATLWYQIHHKHEVLKAATVTISASSVPGRFQHPYRTATQINASTPARYSQLRSTDTANYNSLLGSAGIL